MQGRFAAAPRRYGPTSALHVALSLAVLLMLVACGEAEKAPATPQTGSALDACTLITKDEVEASMGSTAGAPEGRPSPSGRGSSCLFSLETETGRRTLQVAVESPPRGRRFSPADVSSFATSASEEPPAVIGGVGEAAYLADSKLHVLKNSTYLVVGDPQFNESLEPLDPEGLKKVAQKAVERMPR